MTRIDDDLLMAYADGELPAAEVARVEALLARDPAARERVRRYRETAALARAAFASTLEEPVPAALEARIREMARGDEAASGVVPFPRGPRRRSLRRMALPLAASLALVIGLAVGTGLRPEDDHRLLARALETTPSGELGPGEVLPLATLRAADGRWCRRFQSARDGRVLEGVACRDPASGWRAVVLVERETGDGAGYRPAGGAEDPLRPLTERLGLRPVDHATETAAIAGGWPDSQR